MQDRKKDTDVYNGLLDSEGEGEGGMIWENGIVTYILSCKNRIASLCQTQDTGKKKNHYALSSGKFFRWRR